MLLKHVPEQIESIQFQSVCMWARVGDQQVTGSNHSYNSHSLITLISSEIQHKTTSLRHWTHIIRTHESECHLQHASYEIHK